MNKLISLFLSLCISANAFCQKDSVFINQNSEPVLGKVLINFKKEKVDVKDAKDSPAALSFNEIRRIGLANGGVYVSENIKSRTQLLLLLVEGKFSLLFNQKEKLFYVKKSDSLLVVSQAHFKRALPIIFGREVTEEHYKVTNIAPAYTAGYLSRLTSYANNISHSTETIYVQTVNRFKVNLSIGPYVGFGYNRTAFDLSLGHINGRLTYEKTDYFTSNSIPVGLSINVALSKRMSIRLDSYFNNTTARNLKDNSVGTASVAFPNYLLHPERYDRNITLSGYSYKTFHFDLSGSYTLFRQERSKIRPYIFAGATLARLSSAEMAVRTRYRENEQSSYQNFTGHVVLDRSFSMIGINAGLGAEYDAGKRLTFRFAGKFIGGIYPKITHAQVSGKVENTTTMPDSTWVFEDVRFLSSYDQYTRMFTVTGGAYFRL
jgi:outer membrane protein W